MLRESIIAQLDAEIARLTEARKLLTKAGRVVLPKAIASQLQGTKPAKKGAKKATKKAAKKATKRVLSPEARKRIADAQHRRWAKQKSKKS
jgi:hypothetical protein